MVCIHGDGFRSSGNNWKHLSPIPLRAAVPKACAPGWTTVGKRCFKYDGDKRDWADSLKYCESQGGTLASIHNDVENKAVSGIVKTPAYLGGLGNGQGKWKWSDGSPWWQPSSDKHDGINNGETRLAFSPWDGKWHDWENGDAGLGVVCSKDQGIDMRTHSLMHACCNVTC